jgi:hypothetical protein
MFKLNNTKQYSNKKRQIQSYFYAKSPTKSNILALAGNNLELHLKDFESILTTKSKAFVYDINPDVINKYRHLENANIKLIHSNVSQAKPERFIDLDLMCTLNTSTGLLIDMLTKQWKRFHINSYDNKYKTFMFTYANRGNKVDINNVLSIMNCILNNRVIDIEIIRYYDTSIMYTVQIIWR